MRHELRHIGNHDGYTTGHAWDAENRNTSVLSNGVPILANAYDYRHRRVRKTTLDTVQNMIYDGWNLIQETVTPTVGFTTTNRYYWGVDLSGTLQGAGGVGGLLAAEINGQLLFPLYDANGNVTECLDTSGNIRAHYEYDAFGNIIAQSGDLAHAFPFRFSTKYFDAETGFYYYGYRFYSPEQGRWLNRDPIAERGGINLYGFVKNSPVNRIDRLGKEIFYVYYDSNDLMFRSNKEDAIASIEITITSHNLCACSCSSKLFKHEEYLKPIPKIKVKATVSDLGVLPKDDENSMWGYAPPFLFLGSHDAIFKQKNPTMTAELTVELDECPENVDAEETLQIGSQRMGAVFTVKWEYGCKKHNGWATSSRPFKYSVTQKSSDFNPPFE